VSSRGSKAQLVSCGVTSSLNNLLTVQAKPDAITRRLALFSRVARINAHQCQSSCGLPGTLHNMLQTRGTLFCSQEEQCAQWP
jgi:hypothetical protein